MAAATKALENVALLLLDDHLRHCVVDAVSGPEGPSSDEAQHSFDEAMTAVRRLVTS